MNLKDKICFIKTSLSEKSIVQLSCYQSLSLILAYIYLYTVDVNKETFIAHSPSIIFAAIIWVYLEFIKDRKKKKRYDTLIGFLFQISTVIIILIFVIIFFNY